MVLWVVVCIRGRPGWLRSSDNNRPNPVSTHRCTVCSISPDCPEQSVINCKGMLLPSVGMTIGNGKETSIAVLSLYLTLTFAFDLPKDIVQPPNASFNLLNSSFPGKIFAKQFYLCNATNSPGARLEPNFILDILTAGDFFKSLRPSSPGRRVCHSCFSSNSKKSSSSDLGRVCLSTTKGLGRPGLTRTISPFTLLSPNTLTPPLQCHSSSLWRNIWWEIKYLFQNISEAAQILITRQQRFKWRNTLHATTLYYVQLDRMHNRILCKDCPNAQSALETVKRMLPKLKIVSTLPKLSHPFVTSEERLLCNLVRSVLTHTWHTRDGGGQHKARHGCNLEADAPSTHPGHQCRGKKPVVGKNSTFVHQPNAGLCAGLKAIILSSPASQYSPSRSSANDKIRI